MPTQAISVRLPPELIRRLEKMQASQLFPPTLSEVVRSLLERALDDLEKEDKP